MSKEVDKYYELRRRVPSLEAAYELHCQALINALDWKCKEYVIDYGCGGGLFAQKYLIPLAETQKITRVFGVDMNKDLIKYAVQHSSHPSISYSVGNMFGEGVWTFEAEEIDKFLAILVLPYIHDYRTFFEKIYQLLKNGGQFAALFPFGRLYKLAFDLCKTSKWSSYSKNVDDCSFAEWFCQDEIEDNVLMKSALQSCGFKIIECQAHPFRMEFVSIDGLFDFLITVNSELSKIPVELRTELLKEMRTIAPNYLNGSLDSKPFLYNWSMYRIVVEKS